MHSPKEVLAFWFGEPAKTADELKLKMRRWFRGGPEVDAEIVRDFKPEVEAAIAGGLEDWVAVEKGWLALILVLDQFTRNVFRGDARTHAGDEHAIKVATNALDTGLTRKLSCEERHFAITPLIHAENAALQERFATEIAALVADAPDAFKPVFSMGLEQSKKYSDIIARFGRFPHRNEILGRTSTPEESEFLIGWADRAAPKEPT